MRIINFVISDVRQINFTCKLALICDLCTFSVLLTPNIARNGIATQISNFHHSMHPTPDYASYAIDGNFDTSARYANGQCAITQNHHNGGWWQVKLDGIYSVLKVAITTRNGYGMINQCTYHSSNPISRFSRCNVNFFTGAKIVCITSQW